MLHSKIRFKSAGQQYIFNIVHNLDEMGLDIFAAFDNWQARTKEYSLQSFLEYIKSKDEINIIALPKVEFDKANK